MTHRRPPSHHRLPSSAWAYRW